MFNAPQRTDFREAYSIIEVFQNQFIQFINHSFTHHVITIFDRFSRVISPLLAFLLAGPPERNNNLNMVKWSLDSPGAHFSKKKIHGARSIHGSHLEKVKCEMGISLHGL